MSFLRPRVPPLIPLLSPAKKVWIKGSAGIYTQGTLWIKINGIYQKGTMSVKVNGLYQ